MGIKDWLDKLYNDVMDNDKFNDKDIEEPLESKEQGAESNPFEYLKKLTDDFKE